MVIIQKIIYFLFSYRCHHFNFSIKYVINSKILIIFMLSFIYFDLLINFLLIVIILLFIIIAAFYLEGLFIIKINIIYLYLFIVMKMVCFIIFMNYF